MKGAHLFDPASFAGWDVWGLAAVLAVGVPANGYVRFRRFVARDAADPARTPARTRLYLQAIAFQWVLVAAAAFVLRRHGLTLADAGQALGRPRVTLAVSAGLLALLVVVALVVRARVRRARASAGKAVEPRRAPHRLAALVPRTATERATYLALCLTAGLCEEFLYRGWLLLALRPLFRAPWTVYAVAVAIFGIGHVYQGAGGVLRTALIGAQLLALFVLTGSLVPGQVLHAGIDVVAGRIGGLAAARDGRFLREEGPYSEL